MGASRGMGKAAVLLWTVGGLGEGGEGYRMGKGRKRGGGGVLVCALSGGMLAPPIYRIE